MTAKPNPSGDDDRNVALDLPLVQVTTWDHDRLSAMVGAFRLRGCEPLVEFLAEHAVQILAGDGIHDAHEQHLAFARVAILQYRGQLRAHGGYRLESVGVTTPDELLVERQAGIGVTASRVRSRPEMIHGCRPTSVTTHPASTAMNPIGAPSARARRRRRGAPSVLDRWRQSHQSAQSPTSAM